MCSESPQYTVTVQDWALPPEVVATSLVLLLSLKDFRVALVAGTC
jgi:hypothetical protein